MKKGWFLLGLTLLTPTIVSCGGGGGGGLSGVMSVASFVIPAGETRTVTGDLVVKSVADLVIDGELKVVPGARVALYSEADVKIHGPIGTATGRGRVSRQPDTPEDVVLVGRNVEITEGRFPFVVEPRDQGGSIYITTLGETGKVTISQNLVTKPGKDATSRTEVGGNAGSINIGNDGARNAARIDGITGVVKPRVLDITATLTTGRGGQGFHDKTGGETGGLLGADGTRGGDGGNIAIDTTQGSPPTIPRSQVVLGRGGDAGSCGEEGAPIRGKSGSGDGEAGQSVRIRLGREGYGGALVVREQFTDLHAESGRVGHVFAAAGNGGPGGKGGDTIVQLTLLGKRTQSSQIRLEDGGNGGAATRKFQNGGRGGGVLVTVFGQQGAPAVHTVTLTNYGNGAPGFSGCSATPADPGSNGGAGGDLEVPASVARTVQNSFHGGRAADGDPPGVKGAGGTLTGSSDRFPDGGVGVPCSAISTLTFSETEVSLFTNEEKTVTLTRTGPLARATREIQVTVRSQDGSVVNIRNPANNTVAKSHTITFPVGQSSINLNIVGGAVIGNDPDIEAKIVDTEFGTIQTTLEVINSQRLTTVVELQSSVSGNKTPVGTVLTYIPDGAGRVRGIVIRPPTSGCSSWHGDPIGGGGGSGVTVDGEAVFALAEHPCGYGTVIQPTGPTDP